MKDFLFLQDNKFPLVSFSLFCLLFLLIGSSVLPKNIASAAEKYSWELETILDRASTRVTGVGFSPDSRYVAYMEAAGRVYIHRAGGEWPLVKIFYEPDIHKGGDVEFSPDGKWLVYGLLKESRDVVLQVINVEDWTKGIRKTHSPRVGRSTGTLLDLQFSSDNRWLASGTNGNHCFVWNIKNNFALAHVLNPARAAAMSDNGKYLLTTSSSSPPEIYRVGTWEKETTLKPLSGSGSPALGKDKYAFFSDRSNNWWVYEFNTEWEEVVAAQSEYRVSRGAFSNLGQWLALANGKGYLEIIDTTNWQQKKLLKEAGGGIVSISFSADDEYIAYGSKDKNVYVHSVPKRYCEISEKDDNYLELTGRGGRDISELNLEFNEDKSTLTLRYGDKSEFTIKYGEGSSLLIEDTPGGKLTIKLKPE